MLHEELKSVKVDVQETYTLFADLSYPDFEHESVYLAIHGRNLIGDKIKTTDGGGIDESPGDLESHIEEYFQHDSTAEFVVLNGKAYTVGPQARANINRKLIDPELREMLSYKLPTYNPFSNIIFQALEIVAEVDRAINITEELLSNPADHGRLSEVIPIAATGVGAVEAPRGMLLHRYSFDEKGYCSSADVTTPTSQNLRMIEECLRCFVEENLSLREDTLIIELERLIRAFDPCISCSAH